MPIIIKDHEYQWEDTSDMANVLVPLKGVNPKKANIFCSNVYIKVNFPPYMFEADLLHEIDEEASSATISSGYIRFQLKKKEDMKWNSLVLKGDRNDIIARREAGISSLHEKHQETLKAKEAEKNQAERYAREKAWEVERLEKERLKELKDNECKEAEDSLNLWKAKVRECDVETENHHNNDNNNINNNSIVVEEHEELVNAPLMGNVMECKEDMSLPLKESHIVFTENDIQKENIDNMTSLVKKKKSLNTAVRSSGSIEVKFTPRLLRSAARGEKDEEFLRQVTMKSPEAEADSQGIEEQNAVWMKDKGDKFFRGGDYLSAINAYTCAISLDDSMASLFSNRAACHLKVDSFQECIDDCSTALELAPEIVSSNATSRVKAFVRRGTAHMRLGHISPAINDYKDALRLNPTNETLENDLKSLLMKGGVAV